MDFPKNIFGENFLIFGIFKRIFGIKYRFLAYFLPKNEFLKSTMFLQKWIILQKAKSIILPSLSIPPPEKEGKTEKEKGFQKEKIKKKGTKNRRNFLHFFQLLLPKKEEKREEITKFSFSTPLPFSHPKSKKRRKRRRKETKEK